MKIVERKIDDLIGAEYNPRELTDKQYKDLKDSLKRFGIVDPVIVNKHPERMDIIVGGHQRSKVWKDLGNDMISTVEVELSPEKEKELNVRLNKNTGQFDMDALANYFDTKDLVQWGFEPYEFGIVDDNDSDEIDSFDQIKPIEKNTIQIQFKENDYQEAQDLINYLNKKNAYIGGIIIQCLKNYKKNE